MENIESQNNQAQSSSTDKATVLVLNNLLKEQKRARSTDTFFRIFNILLFLCIPVILLVMLVGGIFASLASFASISEMNFPDEGFNNTSLQSSSHTALIDFSGVISDGIVDADRVIATAKKAFENPNSVGVILRINSPGGSPTISDNIYTGLKNLRSKHPKKPFIVVTGDVCASGGYYIAVAGDKIFVNHSSIVGSIGVIHMGFGVKSLMEKIGVTPRIITSGKRKAILNPFEEISPADEAHLRTTLDSIHKRFISVIKEGRGDRLKSNDIYNGLFWSGEEAIKLGLVDGIGSASYVAKNEIGEENIVKYSIKRFDLEALLSSQIQTVLNNYIFQNSNFNLR